MRFETEDDKREMQRWSRLAIQLIGVADTGAADHITVEAIVREIDGPDVFAYLRRERRQRRSTGWRAGSIAASRACRLRSRTASHVPSTANSNEAPPGCENTEAGCGPESRSGRNSPVFGVLCSARRVLRYLHAVRSFTTAC